MSLLLETIRINNGAPQHLQWHQVRLERSQAAAFSDYEPMDLAAILTKISFPEKGVFKCRITYGQHLEKVEIERYRRRKINSLQLVEAGNLDYSLKWADRSGIAALFARKGTADDILMVKNGLLTDTSYANIALFDGEKWFTPATPLLEGTCRARLLSEGLLTEADLRPSDLRLFRKIRLFNAMANWEVEVDKVYGVAV